MFGALRGTPRHVLRVVFALLLLAAATVAACWGVSTLRDATADAVAVITVLGGAAVTLGFALAPVLAGVDDQLDPRRFAVFGVAPRPLAAYLAVASFVSIPVVVLLVVSIALGAVWVAQGASPVAVVVSVILAVVTCVLLARVSAAVASLVLRERRSRELTGLFVLVLLVVVFPVGVFLASLEWRGRVPSQLGEAAATLAVTPLGAAWAIQAEPVLEPVWLAAAVAVGTVAVLVAAWVWLVERLLVTTERPVAVRERVGLGWFAVVPDTPGGAIAARSLVYWLRDRRYLVNLLVIPVAGLLAAAPLLVAGIPFEIVVLVPVPLMALFLGWLPHNDLAYDSTAVWMHLASAVRGFSDRLGRLVPVLLVAVPVLAVCIPIAVALHGRWALLPAMVGVCAALFLSGLGLSSIASAAAPYGVSGPGDSPFVRPQGASGVGAQALVLLGALVASAPALWWAWIALTRDVAAADTAMWIGVGTGVGVLVVGIVVGGLVFDRRGSALMEFAESV